MARESLVEATQEQGHDDVPPPPSRFHRPATVALGLLFLFVPVVAYLLGDRAQHIENRRLAAAPRISQGWEVFPNTSAWFTDHMPLRKEGIHTNTWFSRKVFREEPSYGAAAKTGSAAVGAAGTGTNASGSTKGPPDASEFPTVVSGRDGWLYLGEDFSFPCLPSSTVAQTMTRLRELERIITASGRRVLFTVAPNKSTIVPDHLPSHYVGKDCATARTRAFWTALEKLPRSEYFDLRRPLEARQRADGAPIYPTLNSHWSTLGSAIFARTLANALDHGLWAGSSIDSSRPYTQGADLPALLGETRTETVNGGRLTRPGVIGGWEHLGRRLKTDPVTVTNSTTGVPLFPTRAVLVGDSFTEAALPELTSLFANVVAIQHQRASVEAVASQIAQADVVVIEIVERNMAGGKATMLESGTLDAIRSALNGTADLPSAATTTTRP
jgi:hypothetical protein